MPAGFNMGDLYCEEAPPAGYIRVLLNHVGPAITGSAAHANISSVAFSFGTYITATALFDSGAIARRAWPAAAPVVVWLHAYGYNRGWDTLGNNSAAYLDLAANGYVVVCYDQVGFGIRVREGGAAFYQRYTRGASLLGKMVADVRALVDTLYCFSVAAQADPKCFHAGSWNPSPAALSAIPSIDYSRVFVAGHALGGMVALHAAALDKRIAAVASFAGFTPWRSDTPSRGTGGLRRLSEMHALVPRLGLFIGNETAVPYDFVDLLRAVAPRPTLLVTPRRDRDASFADVATCVAAAREAWIQHGALAAFSNLQPDDYNRMSPQAAAALVAWADEAVKRRP